jgi:hypothetical protein
MQGREVEQINVGHGSLFFSCCRGHNFQCSEILVPKLSWLLKWKNQPLEKHVSLFASGDLKQHMNMVVRLPIFIFLTFLCVP